MLERTSEIRFNQRFPWKSGNGPGAMNSGSEDAAGAGAFGITRTPASPGRTGTFGAGMYGGGGAAVGAM